MNPYALLETIKRRRSCRRFIDSPVDPKILMRLVEGGIHAPSASNSQNCRFLIIDDKDEIRELAKQKSPRQLIVKASAIIVVFCDPMQHKHRAEEAHIWQQTWAHNCAAAIQNILLMAAEFGLGACWVGAVDTMNGTRLLNGKRWKELFHQYDIPDRYNIHGLVLLGEPEEKDEDGYAMGDIRHGGKPIKRHPVENYLIGKKK